MTAKTTTAEPPLYTITRCGDEHATDPPNTASTEPARGMNPWRRAAITAALATAPTPVIVTVATGRAGWTTLVFLADIAAILAAVISHAHAEGSVDLRPEEPVDVSWTDDDGRRVQYRVYSAAQEQR